MTLPLKTNKVAKEVSREVEFGKGCLYFLPINESQLVIKWTKLYNFVFQFQSLIVVELFFQPIRFAMDFDRFNFEF